MSENDLVKNRKAFHDYEILDTYEAGIVLLGTEIKSLREHGGSLQEAYIIIKDSELWLINSNIAQYKYGNVHNHKEKRERKLLMHSQEIEKLRRLTQEKSYTLIPIALYLKKGRVKVKVAVARGKKSFDKREKIKEKEHKRNIEREIKSQKF